MIVNRRSQTTNGGRQVSKRRWITFLATTVAIVVVILGHNLWLPIFGKFLVVADTLGPADAIVVLGGGGQERVLHGARLFGENYVDWFVVTNMPFNVPGIRTLYGELMQREAIYQGVPIDRILIVPGVVETTYEEAKAMRQLAQEQGWRSLIVVTDPFHTRRARMAFCEVFKGSNIAVAVRPVNEHWYHPDSWWQSRDGLRTTWTEYAKLILHFSGYK